MDKVLLAFVMETAPEMLSTILIGLWRSAYVWGQKCNRMLAKALELVKHKTQAVFLAYRCTGLSTLMTIAV